MSALNFSASGTRWRLVVIPDGLVASEYAPPLPGVGLLFIADDGSSRFLPLAGNVAPSIDELRAKSNQELGALAESAPAWPVK